MDPLAAPISSEFFFDPISEKVPKSGFSRSEKPLKLMFLKVFEVWELHSDVPHVRVVISQAPRPSGMYFNMIHEGFSFNIGWREISDL